MDWQRRKPGPPCDRAAINSVSIGIDLTVFNVQNFSILTTR
jgi:hypothetical protein